MKGGEDEVEVWGGGMEELVISGSWYYRDGSSWCYNSLCSFLVGFLFTWFVTIGFLVESERLSTLASHIVAPSFESSWV